MKSLKKEHRLDPIIVCQPPKQWHTVRARQKQVDKLSKSEDNMMPPIVYNVGDDVDPRLPIFIHGQPTILSELLDLISAPSQRSQTPASGSLPSNIVPMACAFPTTFVCPYCKSTIEDSILLQRHQSRCLFRIFPLRLPVHQQNGSSVTEANSDMAPSNTYGIDAGQLIATASVLVLYQILENRDIYRLLFSDDCPAEPYRLDCFREECKIHRTCNENCSVVSHPEPTCRLCKVVAGVRVLKAIYEELRKIRKELHELENYYDCCLGDDEEANGLSQVALDGAAESAASSANGTSQMQSNPVRRRPMWMPALSLDFGSSMLTVETKIANLKIRCDGPPVGGETPIGSFLEYFSLVN